MEGFVSEDVGECVVPDAVRGQAPAGLGTSTSYASYLLARAERSQARPRRQRLASLSRPACPQLALSGTIPGDGAPSV
eukprot:15431986-Heterocapsa_arctica.AAC.1